MVLGCTNERVRLAIQRRDTQISEENRKLLLVSKAPVIDMSSYNGIQEVSHG